jgi:membrane complex biogenesis BtpA family protein
MTSWIESCFGERRALVGMVHVGALPGAPRAREPLESVVELAVREARAYLEAGFPALLIENMHDRPYQKASVGPEVVAGLAVVGREVRRATGLPLGVQVLAGANHEALAVALACGAAFVRAEGFVFAHVGDEGVHESDAGRLLRYRRGIGAEGVRVLCDVKKKHAAHALTADVDLAETARAAEFFLADGVVVTGTATGRPAAPEDLAAVAEAVSVPVFVGSGLNADNLGRYAAADGFIVGSWLKHDGLWSNPLDPVRLKAFVQAFRALPQPGRVESG